MHAYAKGCDQFLSHVLRNFIEDHRADQLRSGRTRFLSHVLRNFIEERGEVSGISLTAEYS